MGVRENLKPAEKQQAYDTQANLSPSKAKTPKTKLKINSVLYRDISFLLSLNLLIAGSVALCSPFFFIDNLHYKVFKPVNNSYHSSCYFFHVSTYLRFWVQMQYIFKWKGSSPHLRRSSVLRKPQATTGNSREGKQGEEQKEKVSFTQIYIYKQQPTNKQNTKHNKKNFCRQN